MSDDIVKRVREIFADTDVANALSILGEFKLRNKLSLRITRCIVVLSEGKILKLLKYISIAEKDWRDVVFLAEKVNHEYNQPFH